MSKFSLGSTALAALLALPPQPAWSQQALEGKVVGTRLTHCDFKPGGCAGTLTLEATGTTNPVEIEVPLGTPIRQGAGQVYLPALRGKTVSVVLAVDKAGKTARSIDVKGEKP
ncbi:hypothetical protein [Aromatoleum toluclasticum]|uniref:hypothetical protein n=1 Tax=Aromatoleum toluclasticum TaxID=92003 RepID=UPI0003666A84|nr:hypothetical protein [Aromatoleum toluclasticum]